MTDKPTIVLVHGAFADASGWDPVPRLLQERGHRVLSVANPLRGLANDTAYLDSVLESVPGPVVLVGHSYGGALIGNATASNVTALVYVAAFAPDEGETLGSIGQRFGGRAPEVLRPRKLADGVELSIDPALYHEVFAPDVDAATAAVLATGQRPLAAVAFEQPAGPPAWKRLPSSYAVATRDQMIPPDGQRFMAARMNATVVEIETGHAAAFGAPEAIADLIVSAT